MLFDDRHDAGRLLAQQLEHYRGTDAIVLGVPRGGVVVAYEVAKALRLPLDVVVTRKIGAPGNAEYAIGAVAESGEALLNDDEIKALGITSDYIANQVRQEQQEIARRVDLYRDGHPGLNLRGKITIIVDDGVATGFTTATALKAVRMEGPRSLVLAVPVAPSESLPWLSTLADQVVCMDTPEPFLAVGRFYVDFAQVSDEEVRKYLAMAKGRERVAEA